MAEINHPPIASVVTFDNGMCMVFDDRGQQIMELQGKSVDCLPKVRALFDGPIDGPVRWTVPKRRDDARPIRRRHQTVFAGAVPRLEWLAAAARDRCCYCGCETWLPWQRRHRDRICQRLAIPTEGYRASRLFEWRMATCEHLTRRADDGGDQAANLALACGWCNSHRGDMPSEIWAIVVAAIIAVGRHPCRG